VVLDEAMSTERDQATAALPDASQRLVRTVDGFHGDYWTAPSLLPGWTRAHVVAHLGLNAAALSRALRGLVADEDDQSDEHDVVPRTMYDSDELRADDIALLAAQDPTELRATLMAETTLLQEALDAVPPDRWESRIERTPGGRAMRAGSFPGMRWRELEIHHVDLDAGYSCADWTQAFAEHLLDAMAKRLRPEQAFEVKPLDSSRTWLLGDGGEAEYAVPIVTGPAADLGWWLTGRRPSATLSCSRGELPSIEGW
jgi:maleylpyruvate isomerase